MTTLADAVHEVLDRLTAAGVRATDDERNLNPPAVFVAPPAIEWRFRGGDYTASWTLWCVTGSSGRSVDLVNLGELVEAVGAALHLPMIRGEPADLLIPHQAAPLPAYRLTWSARVRQPIPTQPNGA